MEWIVFPTLTGSTGSDRLTIDFAAGSPVPKDGVTFEGGKTQEPGDSVIIQGLSGTAGMRITAGQVLIGSLPAIGYSHATVVLSGTNGYTGGTNVESGILIVSTATALPSGRSLSIGSGGTLVLGGGTGLSAAVTTSCAEVCQVIAWDETEVSPPSAIIPSWETQRALAHDAVLRSSQPRQPECDLSWLLTAERFRAKNKEVKRDASTQFVFAMEANH